MPHAERTITIDRPPEQVFAFLADPANDRRWRPGVKEMSALGAPMRGVRVRQIVAGPGGRSIAADIEIDAYDPPTRYAFHAVAGPVRPTGEYRLAPSGDGTALTFSLDAEVGGWKKWVMGGQVQKTMDAEMAALDRAKAILEGG
jgi:carbon monoxide dehydrogenase subunit G